MKDERCPSVENLAAFVDCRVSESVADEISEHVTDCANCEETVAELERRGAIAFDRAAEAPGVFPFQSEPELKRMLEAVKLRGTGRAIDTVESGQPAVVLGRLRDYQICEKIGEGGMGTVYRALHTKLNKFVAVKLLANSRTSNKSAISRFQREISIVGSLQHAHIVQAHDAGEEAGQHYLVMELIEGKNLSEVVRQNGALSVNAACEVISQAAKGLEYAHENGLIHRDIKPSNLMLALSTDRKTNQVTSAVVKILDLGLARLRAHGEKSDSDLTTEGQIIGTLDYMAPEQGGNSSDVDIRADIYSLGATLYYLLAGEPPYSAFAKLPILQRITAISQNEPPALQSRRPDVPQGVAAIVHRMIAKSAEDRFKTPIEVVHALEPFCTGANLTSLLVPESGVTPPVPAKGITASSNRVGKNRHWMKAFGGIAGLLILAIVLLTVRSLEPIGRTGEHSQPDITDATLTLNTAEAGDGEVILRFASARDPLGGFSPPRLGDRFDLDLKFSRPVYIAIVLLNPNKNEHNIERLGPAAHVVFPKPPEADSWTFEEGSGCFVLAVLFSNAPIPDDVNEKLLQKYDLTQVSDIEGVWRFDGLKWRQSAARSKHKGPAAPEIIQSFTNDLAKYDLECRSIAFTIQEAIK